MGLDMYLEAKRYVAGYEFYSEEDQSRYRETIKAAALEEYSDPESPSCTISVNAAYWRKANAIHRWFVEHVCEGRDDCQPYDVSEDDLSALLETCTELLKSRDKEKAIRLLPPQSGFFFGSTEVDEWYWQDVEQTATKLKRVLSLNGKGVFFQYQASW